MDTMLSIKIDKKLKARARETAQALGVSLNAVIIQYIKEFVATRTITFVEYPKADERTRRILQKIKEEAITAILKAKQEPSLKGNLDKLSKNTHL
jgi:antitoxin component of RelBE/YafQ-DinJ toxin-antitoxin module